MSKYIDADKAIAHFNLMYDQTLSADDPYNVGVRGAINYIRFKSSSIEIIRCGECKHRASGRMGKMCCGRDPDDFCSYGERNIR